MLAKNSSLLFVPRILFNNSFIASSVFISFKKTRSKFILCNTSLSNNNSSRRVEDATKSIAGKTRLLLRRRSNCNSILPVPLNSSNITSSILEPVSINAVARMVRRTSEFQFFLQHRKIVLVFASHSLPPRRTQYFSGCRCNRIVCSGQGG